MLIHVHRSKSKSVTEQMLYSSGDTSSRVNEGFKVLPRLWTPLSSAAPAHPGTLQHWPGRTWQECSLKIYDHIINKKLLYFCEWKHVILFDTIGRSWGLAVYLIGLILDQKCVFNVHSVKKSITGVKYCVCSSGTSNQSDNLSWPVML